MSYTLISNFRPGNQIKDLKGFEKKKKNFSGNSWENLEVVHLPWNVYIQHRLEERKTHNHGVYIVHDELD